MKASLALCQICKEPIWNFLCIDCLRTDISRWLPSSFASEFEEFHTTFSRYFKSVFSYAEYCMHCKSYKDKPVCPYCYTNEVYHWLKGKSSDLAARFIKLFFFDFENSGFAENVKTENLVPITEDMDIEKESGICDECGEYAEDLNLTERGWVCRECISYV